MPALKRSPAFLAYLGILCRDLTTCSKQTHLYRFDIVYASTARESPKTVSLRAHCRNFPGEGFLHLLSISTKTQRSGSKLMRSKQHVHRVLEAALRQYAFVPGPQLALKSVAACCRRVNLVFSWPNQNGLKSANGSSNSVYASPSVSITRPFQRLGLNRSVSCSFPYGSTMRSCVAVAECTSARPTKWASLTGSPCWIIGAAKWAGSRRVMVAAGATPLIVMLSLMATDRSERIKPTSYA